MICSTGDEGHLRGSRDALPEPGAALTGLWKGPPGSCPIGRMGGSHNDRDWTDLHSTPVQYSRGSRPCRTLRHAAHETTIYVLSGEASMWFGQELKEHLTVRAGEFLYIPASTPHLPYNPSDTTPCIAVLARTDPNEQESVVLYAGLLPGR